jgi:alkylmercury lyase
MVTAHRNESSVEEIAQVLLGAGVGIAQASPDLARLAVAIYDELAKGVPIPLAEIGRLLGATGVAMDLASAVGTRWMEFDPSGNVTGFAGLTVLPTSRRLLLDGRSLYLWCALDGLVVAHVLGRPVVIHALCPATQTPITVAATGTGVERVEPSDAAMSLVVPEASGACNVTDVRRSVCDHVHLYRSEQVAIDSTKAQGAAVLSLDRAFVLAGLLVGPLKTARA